MMTHIKSIDFHLFALIPKLGKLSYEAASLGVKQFIAREGHRFRVWTGRKIASAMCYPGGLYQ